MYNEEIKQEFIKESVKQGNSMTIDKVATRYFKTVSSYEEGLEKDLSNFTIVEIIGMYKYVCTYSLEVIMQMQSIFKRYTYYCKDIGFVNDGINHYEEVTYDMMKSCTNQKRVNDSIITRKELISLCNKMPNVSDSFLLLAIFEGLSGTGMEDLINLNISQFKGNKVHLESGRVLTVSDELIKYAEESSETYNFYSADARNKLYYKETDDRILKALCNTKDYDPDSDRGRINLVNKLTRLRKRYERDCLTYSHLIESGRIHLVQKYMEEDHASDIRKCMYDHKDELDLRYGKISSYNRYLLKYSEYFEQ